jgi:hypothetical protein
MSHITDVEVKKWWYYGRYEKAHPETIEQSERAILLFGKDRSER